MKYILFSAIAFIIIISCNSNPMNNRVQSQENNRVEQDSVEPVDSGPIEFHVSSGTISGQWLNSKYITTLSKSGSAKEAQKSISLAYIDIKPDDKALIIFSFHEGVTLPYKIDGDSILFFVGDELEARAFLLDTETMVFSRSEWIDTLCKFHTYDENRNNLAINRIIFEGRYRTDSDEFIEFQSNGVVTGIDSYTSYRASDDYYDVGLDVDLLYLTDDSTKLKLTWERSQDTLRLFEVDCLEYDEPSGYCMEIGKGELLYQLYQIK